MAKKTRSPKTTKTLHSTRGTTTEKQRAAAAKSPAAAKVPKEVDFAAEGQLFPIVALGASAGGLDAFTSFLRALPTNTGMGFILIQHMDPTHESVLASLLQRSTRMPISEVTDNTVVEPNHVYIAPPNSLMTITGGVVSLTGRGLRSYKDYPIDRFFVSLAEDRKNRAIGVVLSGTASDGTRGLLAIKAEGGITFAQDTDSAQFPSMPASAVASGCVDFTLPPDKIAQELSRINGHPYIRRTSTGEPVPQVAAPDGVRQILKQLRIVTGVDFELYKPAMIGRRIARRMALHRIDAHQQYLDLIRKDRPELLALYEDIFIHVTGFFRDPESLQAVQRRMFFNLVPGNTGNRGPRTIRIWIPGCSSGEEVYSLAMLLFEQLGERRTEVTVQIFGTDISERSVQRARAGIYPPSSMVDVSPERQRRFFSRADGNFQITKAIRDVCVFARHDLAKDPPFSRMDLISCRNVLIYMGPALQKKVIESFHYALKPGGHLLLGKSESLSAYSSLFATEDSKHKILTRRTLESPLHVHAGMVERTGGERAAAAPRTTPPVSDIRREAERLLLDKYTPAALIVDSNLQIVHFQGNTGPFLAPASGEPSFHLLRIVRPELLVDTRSAIYSAKRLGTPIHKEGIRFKHNGDSSLVDIHVSPIKPRHNAETDYLVVFKETPATRKPPAEPSEKSPGTIRDRTKAELVAKEREIAALREQLQDLVQDHEAADEEVRSMNEEILSSNEELQSTNEELETAKEELESTNEELTTLNDELQKRNADLSQTTDDLSNVLVAMDMPIVLLDSELRIRRFTPAAAKVLNFISTDVGRPLSDIASTIPSVSWKDLTTEVLKTSKAKELEVQNREGCWYALRLRPYRTGVDLVGGLLIAMVDISEVKRSAEEAAAARTHAEELEARLALAMEGSRVGVWEYDIATEEIHGTRQWSALYAAQPGTSLSKKEWLGRAHPEDRKVVERDLDRLITSGDATDVQYRVVWPDGTTHWLNRRAELVRDSRNNPVRIRGISIDITGQKLLEQERLAFSSRIASAQEAERRRIARELHDGLIQDLAAMAMDLSRRVARPPSGGTELKQDYKGFQGRVVKAAEAARHVAYELHPTEVDDLGLVNALQAYCQQVGADSGIEVEFQSRKVPRNLKREIASCLYKVAQEGLRNVVKHAHVSQARVALDTNSKTIRVRLEDKGKGFALSALQASSGLGVASMRERVQLVNGKFTINSEPGKGTQVLAEIPLAEPEEES